MSEKRNHSRTYRELADSIRSLLDRTGFVTKDTRHSLHLIYDVILDMRTSFVKRTKVARKGIGQENVQTLSCLSLEEADANICPCRPPAGCTWLKSTCPIPKSISISSVTNSNAGFKADYVEWSQFKTKLYSRSKKPYTRYFTILDTGEGPYIYLYNDMFLENVTITGLWESPNHAAYFTTCDETETQTFLRCNPLDTPLYMDGDIVDVVFKMTYDFFARSAGVSTVDIKNDSQDNAGQVQNPTV